MRKELDPLAIEAVKMGGSFGLHVSAWKRALS